MSISRAESWGWWRQREASVGGLAGGEVLNLVDGMILGAESFVKEQLGEAPPGRRERKGDPMEGGDWKGLAVAKGIRKKLFG